MKNSSVSEGTRPVPDHPEWLAPLPGALNLRPKTSAILEQLEALALDREALKVSEIVTVLQARAFGALILIAALISLMPIVNIVGALLLIVIGVQLGCGFAVPRLPMIVGNRTVPAPLLGRQMRRFLPPLRWVERYVHPRWPLLTARPVRMITGLLLIALGVVLFVPIPLSQLLPGLTASVLALSLLQRDGLTILIGFALTALSLVVGYFMLAVTIHGAVDLWRSWVG